MALFLIFFFCFLGSTQSFDYTLYATQWAPSYCSDSTLEDDIKCRMPVKTNNFSIHGIWPSNNNGVFPSNCTGEEFSYDRVKGIARDLDQYWPDLRNVNSNIGFWQYEWNNHGKCTGWKIENYFGIGVARAKQFNVLSTLKMKGIVVGGEYDLSHIKSAFRDNVQAKCNINKKTKKVQLQELRFCLDINGGFTPCNANLIPSPSCITNDGTLVEKIALPDATVV